MNEEIMAEKCHWKRLDRLSGVPTEDEMLLPHHIPKRDVDGWYCARCGKRF